MGIDRLMRALWTTPENLAAISAELQDLAPLLGAQLEVFLFDAEEDAAVDRTLLELARRTSEWPPEHRATLTLFVQGIDRRVLAMCERAEVGRLENCVMLMQVVAAWIAGRGTALDDLTDERLYDSIEITATTTQMAVAILAQAAKTIGDDESALALVKLVPVYPPEPTKH